MNTFDQVEYFNGNQWERLIKKNIAQFKKFYFTYDSSIDNFTDGNSLDKFINQYTSSFWIERKWFREMRIDSDTMPFLIHPNRFIEKSILR